jgi:pyruvate/2-oxoglutarate dehydrogenase complex dihydrolipoamide dehydrogenase (E3) component
MGAGSCINVACIPTKKMVRSAKVADLARRAAESGIRVAIAEVDLLAMRRHKQQVVDDLICLTHNLLKTWRRAARLAAAASRARSTENSSTAAVGETGLREQPVVRQGT